MITIYKYPIKLDEKKTKFFVELPKGAEVVSATKMKSGSGFIYALVDSDEQETIEREVYWAGTGWPLDMNKVNSYQFLGTFEEKPNDFQSLIWHVWVEKEDINFAEVFSKLLF